MNGANTSFFRTIVKILLSNWPQRFQRDSPARPTLINDITCLLMQTITPAVTHFCSVCSSYRGCLNLYDHVTNISMDSNTSCVFCHTS